MKNPQNPLKFAEGDHAQDCLACLCLDPQTATALALPGGEPSDALHITLSFCKGGATMGDIVMARALVNLLDAGNWTAPLRGKVSGYGRFLASAGSDDKDVFYASVDIPELEDLAERVEEALERAGMTPSSNHGFVPHITLAYVEPGAPNPVDTVPALDLMFNTIHWCVGGLGDAEGSMTAIPLTDGWGMFTEGKAAAELAAVCASEKGKFRLVFGDPKSDILRFSTQGGAFPEWVPVLPKPAMYTHPVWGDLAITPDRNEEFVRNFNNNVYQEVVPVDAEHETKLGGAFGYMTEMRLNADGSADGKVELTERGKVILGRDGFRYVSPEWYDTWQQPETSEVFHNVIIGLAFTNNPFFKEKNGSLRPILAASDGQMYWPNRRHDAPGDSPALAFHELARSEPGESTVTEEEKAALLKSASEKLSAKTAAESGVTLTADEALAFAEIASGAKELARQFGELQETVKTLSQNNAELKTARLTATFREEASKWTGATDDHVATLMDLSTIHGEASEPVERYKRTMRAATEQAKSNVLDDLGDDTNTFSEKPSGNGPVGMSALVEVEAAVTKLMAENPSATRGDAIQKVFNADPKLYARYVRQTEVKVK